MRSTGTPQVDAATNPAEKSDILRLVILQQHGGVSHAASGRLRKDTL